MKEKNKLGTVERTARGFEIIEFKDRYEKPCSLQQSSLAVLDKPGTSAVWLGIPEYRMHLDRGQVEALVNHLKSWLSKDTFEVKP